MIEQDWIDIPNYEGLYQANYLGEIRRIYKSGKTKVIAQFMKTSGLGRRVSRKRLFVRLSKDCIGKEIPVFRIMVQTFFKIPDEKLPYHKDGDVTNNWVSNIGFTDKHTLGKMTGAISSSIPVKKIDKSGNVVATYPSSREAAIKNGISYQTVLNRCNGYVKKPFLHSDFDYHFGERPKHDSEKLITEFDKRYPNKNKLKIALLKHQKFRILKRVNEFTDVEKIRYIRALKMEEKDWVNNEISF